MFAAIVGACLGAMCADTQANLLPNPANPAARGPYPVSAALLPGGYGGAERNFTVQVFYPAAPGSELAPGVANFSLDVLQFLPPGIATKVKPSLLPHPQYPGMFAGLPPAWQGAARWQRGAQDEQGELPTGFPAIVFVHGTAGWRSQSLSLVSHWASRGFVVAAADSFVVAQA